MKTYYIYYLPNAVRDYGNGKILYGKIGCTDNYDKRIIHDKSFSPKFGVLDITGHHVLETVYGTKADAEAIEYEWQLNNGLVDGSRLLLGKPKTMIQRQKMSESRAGIPKSDETKQKMRDVPRSECPHCGKMVNNAGMARHHGNRCKHKQ
jgi:hypothetical protein